MTDPNNSTASAHKIPAEHWGQLGHLTDEQQECYNIFMERIDATSASVRLVKENGQACDMLEFVKCTVETREQAALRYLRARTFIVEKSMELLKQSVKMRIDKNARHYAAMANADDTANCNVAALRKFYPHGQSGFDKCGRPILYELSGHVDSTAICQMTTMEGLIAYHWWTMESRVDEMFSLAAERRRANGDTSEIVNISTCVILDMSGLTMMHATPASLSHMRTLIGIDNICYPEMLGKLFVVNAPSVATVIYDMIK